MTHPYPPRLEQSCGNCFYVVLFDKEITQEGVDLLECHRHAPNPAIGTEGSSFQAYWPDVDEVDWCGEWAPQEVPA